MADPRYSIDFNADLSPALALLGQSIRSRRQERMAAEQAKASNARSDAYLDLQREAMRNSEARHSAEVARQLEADKYKRAVEAFKVRPDLFRQARQSPEAASQNPYGYAFEARNDLPANVEGPELSPTAEAARFMLPKAARPAPLTTPDPAAVTPPSEPDYSRPHMPSPSAEMRGAPAAPPQMIPSGYVPGTGMEGFGEEERQRAASNLDLVGQGLAGPQVAAEIPEPPTTAAAAARALGMEPGPEGKRRVFATYGGQRFELPEQNDTLGLGPEYDSIYRNLLASGEDEDAARKYVLAEHKADKIQRSIGDRAQSAITARNLSREDTQEFTALQNKLYKNEPMTAAEREKLARIRAQAQMSGNPFKQEGVNDRLFGLLDRRAKAVRDTGMFSKLATNDKVVRGIAANLATGTEGLQHKDAQIQLARYFRQAQPTEGEMHLLYQNLGGWTDSFAQFKAKVMKGDLSPEQLRQMRKSARTVLREHEEDKKRFYQVARSGLGPGSGLDEIPDQAQKQFDMMAAELGIEPGTLPPLYETEGGVTLGTKQAPRTQPRGTKKTELDRIEEYLDSLGGGGGR